MIQTTPRHERADDLKTPPETGADQSLVAPSGPQRKCLVTGEVLPKDQLLRFVAAPDGTVTADFSADLPGRGFYLVPTRANLEQAVKKRLFARGAKAQVKVPDGFVDSVATLARKRALQRMGLMRRNGDLKIGYTKTNDLLEKGRAGLYLRPTDAKSADCDKLCAKLGMPTRCYQLFESQELGLALGRDHLMHVAAKQGRQCQALVKALTVVQLLAGDLRPTSD